MSSTWQQGLRSNVAVLNSRSQIDDDDYHGMGKSNVNEQAFGKKGLNNKRVGRGRAALGDISNRSMGLDNHGGAYGGLKTKKSGMSMKPSFTVATESRNNVESSQWAEKHSSQRLCDMDMSLIEEDYDMEPSDEVEFLSIHHQPLPPLDPCDINDLHNPKYAAEYVLRIYEHLLSVETNYLPSPSYMDKQTDINCKMRALLVDWLIQVHIKFELLPQTLYLTVNILDRFLEAKIVTRRKLQLVGCASMLAASKYEEIYAPECSDFVSMSDNAFTVDELLDMESLVLNTLNFNVTVPSPYTFLRRYMKVACSCAKTQHFATYLVERSLQEYEMLKFQPSILAASALYIAQQHAEENHGWSNVLKRHTTYVPEDLIDCVQAMKHLYSTNQKNYLQAVNKKYASSKYMHVSMIAVA